MPAAKCTATSAISRSSGRASIRKPPSAARKPGDHFVDYCTQGKRAYHIASTIPADEAAEENEVLERLSQEFELCAYGLGEARKEWERRDGEGPGRLLVIN